MSKLDPEAIAQKLSRMVERIDLVGETEFISLQLAGQLSPCGSFRNVLAHEYDEIDPVQV